MSPPPLPKTHLNATQIEARFQAGLQLTSLYELPIYKCPPEIMLMILSRLELRDFPSLIAACWHLLRHIGVAPIMLTSDLKETLTWPRHGFYGCIEHATDASRECKYLPPLVRQQMRARLAPRPQFFQTFTDVGARLSGGFQRLPAELRDQVFRQMDIETLISVALAGFRFSDRDIEWLTHEEI